MSAASNISTPTYQRRRHARLTRSMKNLAPAVLCILTELRYRLADGERRAISNAELAVATGYSEGYISAALRWLAGEAIFPYYPAMATEPAVPFIERTRGARGQPSLITMLPPPELRTPEPSPELSTLSTKDQQDDLILQQKDHPADPLPKTRFDQEPSDDSRIRKDHPADPSIFLVTCTQQQQSDHTHMSASPEEADAPPPAATIAALLANDDPTVVGEILRANPRLTVDEFHDQVAAAEQRSHLHTPRGAVLAVLRLGKRIRPGRTAPPPPREPKRRRDRSLGTSAAELGAYFSAAAPPPPPLDPWLPQAQAIAPPGCTDADLAMLASMLADGASSELALDEFARRQRWRGDHHGH